MNVSWHPQKVSHLQRQQFNGHRPVLLWYTGLSGSGKSTLANAVDALLFEQNCHTYLLDGDNIRHGLNGDLTFSDIDRVENIRRIGEVSKLFIDAGLIISTAFISPFSSDRKIVRSQLPEGQFIEVFVDTPLDVCEARDPKGLYKKARKGEIKNFTGIDSVYEPPEHPEIHIKAGEPGFETIEACAQHIVTILLNMGIVSQK